MKNLWHIFTFMWAWPNWIGNISASIIVTVCVGLLWPQVRHRIEKWVDAKMHFHHNELKKHIDAHMEKVHQKLDK